MIAFLRYLFLQDIWLKLFSLALAVLTWVTITFALARDQRPAGLGPRLYERTFEALPVMIMSAASDVRDVRVNPKQVDITVQAEARVLNQLQARDIRLLVDLTGIEAAQGLRKRIEVSTPAGVTHVRVSPNEVEVLFPGSN
jgi:YbbR domain-containing protein